jgi:hypothetical protein
MPQKYGKTEIVQMDIELNKMTDLLYAENSEGSHCRSSDIKRYNCQDVLLIIFFSLLKMSKNSKISRILNILQIKTEKNC